MTAEQFAKLLELMSQSRHTITGASDWPMLVAMVSLFGVMLLGLIGLMWADLRGKFCENTEEHLRLWKAQGDCQDDCCPRGGRRAEDHYYERQARAEVP